ncbi:hypothetical protein Tco_1524714 [Tanacetum coccineum]
MESYHGGNCLCKLGLWLLDRVKVYSLYALMGGRRFKFSTKILLHEVNVHAKKLLDLATEFDKVDPYQRMSIIVEAVKKTEERDESKTIHG